MQKISKLNQNDIEMCYGKSLEEITRIAETLENSETKKGIISIMVKGIPKPLWSWPMSFDEIKKQIDQYEEDFKNRRMIKIKNTLVNPDDIITMRINLYIEGEQKEIYPE